MALGQVGSMTVALLGDINTFNRNMDQAGTKVGTFAKQVGAAGVKIQSAGKAMSLAITLPLVGFGIAAIKFAADAEEIQSKFDAVFKEFAEQTTVWVEEFADAVNRNATDLKEYASVFQDTFVPLGFARGDAADLSMALVELTIDLASFNNASEPETMRALQSAIVGNHETVRKFGVIINQAGLNIELMNMGIRDGVEAATEAEKAQARLNLIIRGTADAQGDAARTSESFTNQMRGMKAELKAVGEDIGEILIPYAIQLVEKVKELTAAWGELSDEQRERIIKYLAIFAVAGPALYAVGTIAKLVPALYSLWAAIAASPVGMMLAAAAAGVALSKSFATIYAAISSETSDFWHDITGQTQEQTAVTQLILDEFVRATGEAADKLRGNILTTEEDLATMTREFVAAQVAAGEALKSGELRYDEAMEKFRDDTEEILNSYGIMNDGLRAQFRELVEAGIVAWEQLTGATRTATKEISSDVEVVKKAGKDLARGVIEQNKIVAASVQSLTNLNKVEWVAQIEDVEEWGTEYKNIIASTLSDVTYDIVTFHRVAGAAEKTHRENIADILQDASFENEEARQEALQREIDDYAEQRPKITDIITQGFADMRDAILKSAIDKATQWVVDQFWNMATEAQLATDATNAAMGGLALPWQALIPLWLGISEGANTLVQDLNKWLTDLIYGAGTYEERRGGTVAVPSFAGGGIVPGPIGAPQLVMAHGGETISERAIDYMALGNAVQAGTYDAMVEVMSRDRGRPIVVQLPDGTRLAQALYNPLESERARRGG